MDFDTEANIVRALGKIVKAGHLKKGSKPVYWCMDCSSALAEAEVEYQDKQSPMIDVGFPVVDSADLFQRIAQDDTSGREGDVSVIIWTTTPWTLPANQAVSIHPDFDYVLVQIEQGGQPRRIIVAEGLLEAFVATL